MNHQLLFINQVLDFFFPTLCLGCDKRGEWFCNECNTKTIIEHPLTFCILCQRYTGEPGRLCRICARKTHLTGLVAYAYYNQEEIKKAIEIVKYQGVWRGIEPLAQRAWQRWQRAITQKFQVVVAIPLSAHRRRWRGYNQAELLSNFIAKQTGLPMNYDLIKTSESIPQVGLNRHERQNNVQGVFAWRGKSIKGRVILVDDVVTTGATLGEAARVLRSAGAREIWAFTLAYESKKQ